MLEADADPTKGLPKTDIQSKLHERLLLMKRMRQLDGNDAILDHCGLASVAAQEAGKVLANPGFAQPQTDHWNLS